MVLCWADDCRGLACTVVAQLLAEWVAESKLGFCTNVGNEYVPDYAVQSEQEQDSLLSTVVYQAQAWYRLLQYQWIPRFCWYKLVVRGSVAGGNWSVLTLQGLPELRRRRSSWSIVPNVDHILCEIQRYKGIPGFDVIIHFLLRY